MSSLLDLINAKKQQLAAGNRRKTIKPAPGTGRYRILPSWRGANQQFWHDFGQHFVKNEAKELKAVYMCTAKTFGKDCPVCDAISQGIKAATDDSTMDILKDARSSGRILVNAIHLDGPEATRGEVQILELPPTAFTMIINIAKEWEEAEESLFDLSKGKDLLITREGEGLKTKYTVQVAAKTMPLPSGAGSKLHDLDEYVAQESSEDQLRALNQVRSVSGLLAAPSTARAIPFKGAAALEEADDPYATATPPKKAIAAPVAAPDVSDVPVKPAKAASPVLAASAAAVAAVSTGDDELDDLLANLA
jgi:hypothetical protein